MRQQHGGLDPDTVVMPKIGDTVILSTIGNPPWQPPNSTVPMPFGSDRHQPGGDRDTVVLPRVTGHDNRPHVPSEPGVGDGWAAGHGTVGLPLPDAHGAGKPSTRIKRAWRVALVRHRWIVHVLFAAAALTVDRRPMVAIVMATIVVLAIGNAVITVGGHHPHEWIRFWFALRRRNRRQRTRPPGALGPLNHLLPRSRLTAIPGTGDRQLGVMYDGTGWAAVMAVTAPVTAGDGTWLVRLTEAVGPAVAGTTAHVVLHQRGPAPDGLTGSQRQAWIVMRTNGTDVGAPVNIGPAGVGVVLRTCVRRLSLALAEAGLTAVPLDVDEVRAALESAMQTRTVGPRSAAVESWRAWSCAGRTHVSFQIRAWSVPLVGQLLHGTASAIGATTTVSLPIGGTEDSRTGPALLRISHPDRRRAEATADALRSSGIRLRRTNGRHLPAVAATIPLGRPLP